MPLLKIPEMAQAIHEAGTPRDVFAALYRNAQRLHGVTPQETLEFEAAAAGIEDDTNAFQIALTMAAGLEWFEALENLLMVGGYDGGALAAAAAQSQAGGSAAPAAEEPKPEDVVEVARALLEAMSAPEENFLQPETLLRGIQNAIRWTGKILIQRPGEAARRPRGTGILIRPNLVLTAWHVVQELFKKDEQGNYQELPDSGDRLFVQFDDVLTFLGRGGTSRIYGMHRQWCVAFSPATPDEIQEHLPTDLSLLKKGWDYAILRLNDVPGLERHWCEADSRIAVPEHGEPLTLFQHPGGQPLLTHFAAVAEPLPPETVAVPCFRFLHSANSLKGSSGGPCFNRDFYLVGIHQGEWPRQASSENKKVVNRGIPLQVILKDITQRNKGLPPPDPEELRVWHLDGADNYDPVIGCDGFQESVWTILVPGTKRILSLTGLPGSGKSFRARVLTHLLRSLTSEHLVVTLGNETLSTLPGRGLAAHIMQVSTPTSAPPAGLPALTPPRETDSAALPVLTPPLETDSTGANWIRDEVIPILMTRLDQNRQGRPVWLVLQNLNRATIGNGLAREFASDLLFRIYEETVNRSWLRIVLDDPQTELPELAKGMVHSEQTTAITEADLKAFFRRFAATLGGALDDQFSTGSATTAWEMYETLRQQDATTAMERFKGILTRVLERTARDNDTTLARLLSGGPI